MKKIHLLLLSLLSAVLLSLSWQVNLTILIFIALVPLLMIEETVITATFLKRKRLTLLGLSFLIFLIWNVSLTWWIAYASLEGAIMAILCNSILMSSVFMIYHGTRQRINKSWGIWLLIPTWLAFEYGHSIWDLTWTWLTIGNVFAFNHNWIQWYEYTGVSGGSLWVLVINILIASLLKKQLFQLKTILPIFSVLTVPIVASLGILYLKKSTDITLKANVVVVQPNVDPYNEKFNIDFSIQLSSLLKQLKGQINENTDYLVLPETFLTETIWEHDLDNSFSVSLLRDSLIDRYPKLKIVTGANTLYAYKAKEKPSITARKFSDSEGYYDVYNTALQIDKDTIQVYHKSKLVPGVERMPFPALLKPLENYAIDLGGTSGSLGMQDDRSVFFNTENTIGIAPVICYESVYSDYITDYAKNGANLIFILTNDGWWDNTPGHIQHLNYARLRAIETRCQIARSANTGISCFVDELGNISQATEWWKPAVIKHTLLPNTGMTFFSKYGDLLSKTSVFIALFFVIGSYVLGFKRR